MGEVKNERSARAWIETAPSPPLEEARDKPMGGQRLDPEIDLMYAEVAARRRSQLVNLKGRKRMAEGPQRSLTTAEEPGVGEMPIRALSTSA